MALFLFVGWVACWVFYWWCTDDRNRSWEDERGRTWEYVDHQDSPIDTFCMLVMLGIFGLVIYGLHGLYIWIDGDDRTVTNVLAEHNKVC